MIAMQAGTSFAHFLAGRYDQASSWTEKAMWAQANYLTSIRIAAASEALAGKHTEAQEAVARLRELDSSMCIANVRDGGKSLPSKPVNNETTHWCVLRHIPKSRRRDP